MILLADGGSTKVEWCLADRGTVVKQIFTKGANPFFRTSEDIAGELRLALLPEIEGYTINSVHFFGAGCANPEKNEVIKTAITSSLNITSTEVGSDMLAAAKGLCGHNEGIVCIMGTGSNSCFYNGREIVKNVSPLGYILGDEGSGAVLGRLLVGACLKNQLSPGLKEKFLNQYGLTQAEILDRVYKQPLANKFLAGLSPFLLENIEDQTVYDLVYNAFKDFFVRNVMQYDYARHKVRFTGSVAYHYQDLLRKTGKDLGLQIGDIEKSPMDGLVKYYSEL